MGHLADIILKKAFEPRIFTNEHESSKSYETEKIHQIGDIQDLLIRKNHLILFV